MGIFGWARKRRRRGEVCKLAYLLANEEERPEEIEADRERERELKCERKAEREWV